MMPCKRYSSIKISMNGVLAVGAAFTPISDVTTTYSGCKSQAKYSCWVDRRNFTSSPPQVGAGTGAMPHGPVSSSRLLKRSMRISRTTLTLSASSESLWGISHWEFIQYILCIYFIHSILHLNSASNSSLGAVMQLMRCAKYDK